MSWLDLLYCSKTKRETLYSILSFLYLQDTAQTMLTFSLGKALFFRTLFILQHIPWPVDVVLISPSAWVWDQKALRVLLWALGSYEISRSWEKLSNESWIPCTLPFSSLIYDGCKALHTNGYQHNEQKASKRLLLGPLEVMLGNIMSSASVSCTAEHQCLHSLLMYHIYVAPG